MQFKRLRLSGFKSFVDPTELWIEGGLTGVVGPNGCGKSNVLEALRWVMGEQSPKSMRGGEMDDVIFAGTTSRPARNIAEVTLLLDNRHRTAPAMFNDSDEIEVSRRIERDLGSVYKLNGRDVRQKDIQLLFADAATGAHSPALVSQGRVGALINAKPAERRQILEEAAGITGLHARRKEAEQRLRAADHNLRRLGDLMDQMAAQAASLKRQARQAERYRAISGDIDKAEARLLHGRWSATSTQLDEAERATEAASAIVAELTRTGAAIATDQATQASKLPDLRKAEAEAAAALTHLRLTGDNLDREAQAVAERHRQLSNLFDQATHDLDRERAIAADSTSAIERLAGEAQRLQLSLAEATSGEVAAAEQARIAETAASAAEAAYDRLSAALAAARARAETLDGAKCALERREERLAAERQRLQGQRATLPDHSAQDQARIAAERDAALAQTALDGARAAVEAAMTAALAAQAARERSQAALQRAEAELGRCDAEIAALDAVLRVDDHAGTPVAAILTVDPGFETALAVALGDDIDAPLDQGGKYWRDLGPLAATPALPKGATPLGDHVQAPAALARRLALTGLIAAADGPGLAAMLVPGQALVSRDGDVWRWDGFTAAADAPSAASVRLAQRNRRAALAELRDQRLKALDHARADHDREKTGFARAQTTQAAARQSETTAAQRLNDAQKQATRLARATSEQRGAAEAIDQALARLDAEIAEVAEEYKAALATLATLPDLAGLEAEAQAARGEAGAKRSALLDARGGFDRLRREIDNARDRIGQSAREQAQWTARKDSAALQTATLEARVAETGAGIATLAERPAALAQERARLAGGIKDAETVRAAAADRLGAAEAELAAIDRAQKAEQEKLASARERRARLDAEREAAQARKHEIAMAIGQAYHCPPPLLPERIGFDPQPPLLDILERKLEGLKAERERLGAVNLRAEVELGEIEAELARLSGEKADLETAIARLRAGINSLNREGRERLMAAFVQVNGHFSALFTSLFGGGEAYLALVDGDDPLEAGLEIMASPPGKKLQSLSLLSGGEQALTALSLIFAVFMTNPAPICVLDEVDAPLDDANVERFCDLLDEMTRRTDTRFLIVTHNAVTMARMQRLFGVTMAERGVSQLVSVDLQAAASLRAAE